MSRVETPLAFGMRISEANIEHPRLFPVFPGR